MRLVDDDGRIEINFPPDWTLREIRNALEQSNQLQQSLMYFGNPRLNSQLFERQLERTEDRHPGRIDGRIEINFPPDWTLREIRNALEQSNQLQQSLMYFGNPRLNSQLFERQLERTEDRHPGRIVGRRNAKLAARRGRVLENINRANKALWG